MLEKRICWSRAKSLLGRLAQASDTGGDGRDGVFGGGTGLGLNLDDKAHDRKQLPPPPPPLAAALGYFNNTHHRRCPNLKNNSARSNVLNIKFLGEPANFEAERVDPSFRRIFIYKFRKLQVGSHIKLLRARRGHRWERRRGSFEWISEEISFGRFNFRERLNKWSIIITCPV